MNQNPEHPHAHSHGLTTGEPSERRVGLALLITGTFLILEVIGGFLSGSLVLLADAGHMLVDFLALGLSWLGFRIARRPADLKRSYGYHRFPVLAAFVNGLALFFISGMIVVEAVERLIYPPEQILGGLLLGVAIAGLLANLVCYAILTGGKETNINVRSAALHVLGDLLGSVAAIIAAGVIMATSWTPIDPILSVVVCLLILRSAWAIVAKSGHILMQGTPPGFEAEKLRSDLLVQVPELEDVHQVHVWELTEGKPVVSLHARLKEDRDPSGVLVRIKTLLRDSFDLSHSVVQLEGPKDCCPD